MLTSGERRRGSKQKKGQRQRWKLLMDVEGGPWWLGMRKPGREWAKGTAERWKFCSQPKWKAHRGLELLLCHLEPGAFRPDTDLGVSLWKVPEAL